MGTPRPLHRSAPRRLPSTSTRSLGILECDVTDEGGSLVARVYGSCLVLRGNEAQRR